MSPELNHAPPIWIDAEPVPNTWACFRHSFDLHSVSAQAITRVSVDSKYWLWVNGTLVVREGGLKRGPTRTAGYVDELDLAPHLRAGRNTLAVLVWYFGIDGASHLGSGRAYLKLGADLEGISPVETNGHWRGRRHPAFLEADERPTLNGKVLLSEHAIHFDGRLDLVGWTEPDFDDSSWPLAVELPRSEQDLGDQPRPIGFWLDGEITPYTNDSELALPRTGPCELVGQLPANLQLYPWLRVRGEQGGETIRIQIERHKFTSTYTCRVGENAFEVPAWGNGHWVGYEIPAGVTVEALGYRETMFPALAIGEFTSSEEWMNVLWCKAVRTQQICMRDTFMDCPDRERSPWPGDFANMAEFCGYALGAPGLALLRKSLAEFVAWRTEDGILWGPTPTGRFQGTFREFPAQSLATVAVGLRDYYWHSGDLEFIKSIYPVVRHYLLNIYQMEPNGHVPHRGPWETGWDSGTQSWYDWGAEEEQDKALMDQAWYGLALQTLSNVAQDCGDAATGKQCHERLLRGRQLLQSWWDESQDAFRSPGFRHSPDPRGNALAALAGYVPLPYQERLAHRLSNGEGNSIYMEKHVVDALVTLGRTDLALSRIERRYGPDLATAYSTLPENFGEDGNHAWGVGPAATLIREVVGLRPWTPGWGEFLVAPADVPLEYCSARVPTPWGDISINLHRGPAEWRLKLEVPQESKAHLVLPPRFERIEGAPPTEKGGVFALPRGASEIVARGC